MKNYQVYVIAKNGKPLMPTKRFGKVKRLLKSGKARVVERKPFTIQLLYDTTEYIQPLTLGIDSGYSHIAVVARKENAKITFAGELLTRTEEVTVNMTERRMHRRGRRNHRRLRRQRRAKKSGTMFTAKEFAISGTGKAITVNGIKPKLARFHNRCRHESWRNPTLNHLLETHKNFIAMICKILPIAKVRLEYSKFDIQKLEKPEIGGTEYQNGRMKGYANVDEYVLCRDKHTCRLCQKKNVSLQVHHVIWRSKGGQDTPENLVTVCEQCHAKIHKSPKANARVKEIFQGIEKQYMPTTALNCIMPYFYDWLKMKFVNVSKTYGYETKEKRRELDMAKEHFIDAYLISFAENPVKYDFQKILVYKFQQFRRHNRQLIHATRDRNYKDGKTIVAKNRNKRMGQLEDSLAEVVQKNGCTFLRCLRVLPGMKIVRKKFNLFNRGDTVKYKECQRVVKGFGSLGRTIGFLGEKKYISAKGVRRILKNNGIVCT